MDIKPKIIIIDDLDASLIGISSLTEWFSGDYVKKLVEDRKTNFNAIVNGIVEV